MADTHINAFFGAVDEAEKEVLAAHAKWEAAKAALESKKKEVGYVEHEIETEVSEVEEELKPEVSKLEQKAKRLVPNFKK